MLLRNEYTEKDADIREIIHEFFTRYSDPSRFPVSNSKGHESVVNIANDALGMALVFSECSKVFLEEAEKYQNAAHAYLAYSNDLLNQNIHLTYSPWVGLEAISSVITTMRNANYQNFSNQLDEIIFNKESLNHRLDTLKLNKKNNDIHPHLFDTLYGISGYARYLTCRSNEFSSTQALDLCISELLDFLTINLEENNIPNCYVPFHNQSELDKKSYMEGHLDLGLSHGVSGPLATLAIYNQFVKKDKSVETTIKETAQFLISLAQKTEQGIIWPKKIPSQDLRNNKYQLDNRNDSWCYGEVGIARSIFLAARTLEDKEMESFAISIYEQICHIEPKALKLFSLTFCHGYAGLAHMFHQMYLDTNISNFKDYYILLINFIVDTYKKEDTSLLEENKSPGVLDGEGGLILALLASLSPEKKNDWDWLFLIN